MSVPKNTLKLAAMLLGLALTLAGAESPEAMIAQARAPFEGTPQLVAPAMSAAGTAAAAGTALAMPAGVMGAMASSKAILPAPKVPAPAAPASIGFAGAHSLLCLGGIAVGIWAITAGAVVAGIFCAAVSLICLLI